MIEQKVDKMKAYNERVKKRLPGGIHYNFNLPWEETPIHFVRAKDSYVWDMNGKEYLDLYARFGSLLIGHGNEDYNERLKEMIDRVLSVSHCDIDAETIELLSSYIPSAEMIRFGVSGTEIVQNALRLARAYTGRNRFIRFEGHYHGNADNIMGGKATKAQAFIPSDYAGDLKGTAGRADQSLESQSYLLPWNDENVLEELLASKGDDIAAIITEPVCVNGGSVMPAPGYLKKMRQLCDQYGVILIFDEIITGFRMGLGGAQATFGVTPDLTTLGKAIAGGGVPVAALAGKKDIMQLLVDKKVIHAGTFNGYPLGMAAIKATIELLQANDGSMLTEMNQKMTVFHQMLMDEAENVGLPLVVQGPPSCASFHFSSEELKNPQDYTFDIMSLDILLNAKLAENGILVSSISRMYPNISLNQVDLEQYRVQIREAMVGTKEIYDEIYE